MPDVELTFPQDWGLLTLGLLTFIPGETAFRRVKLYLPGL